MLWHLVVDRVWWHVLEEGLLLFELCALFMFFLKLAGATRFDALFIQLLGYYFLLARHTDGLRHMLIRCVDLLVAKAARVYLWQPGKARLETRRHVGTLARVLRAQVAHSEVTQL